jgi:hypothetical protein
MDLTLLNTVRWRVVGLGWSTAACSSRERSQHLFQFQLLPAADGKDVSAL